MTDYLVECDLKQATCASAEEAVILAYKSLDAYCRNHPGTKFRIVDDHEQTTPPGAALERLGSEPHLILAARGLRRDSPVFGAVAHIWEKKFYEEDGQRSMDSLGGILKALGPNVSVGFAKPGILKR